MCGSSCRAGAATGEGIYQAMQSGVYAADAVADVVAGCAGEKQAWSRYVWKNRQRFTFGFVMGHVLRGALKTPLFDAIAVGYNTPLVRKLATWAVGSALAGSHVDATGSRAQAVVASAASAAGAASPAAPGKCPFPHGQVAAN